MVLLLLDNCEFTPHPNDFWLNVSFLPVNRTEHSEETYLSLPRTPEMWSWVGTYPCTKGVRLCAPVGREHVGQ